VPSDLVKAFGKDEFSRSLRTSDERAARKLARSVIAEWARQFEEARSKPDLSTADAETLARAYYHDREREDQLERDHRPIAAHRDASIEKAMLRFGKRMRQAKGIAVDPLEILNLALDELGNFELSGMALDARQIRLRELRAQLTRREYALIAHGAERLIHERGLP